MILPAVGAVMVTVPNTVSVEVSAVVVLAPENPARGASRISTLVMLPSTTLAPVTALAASCVAPTAAGASSTVVIVAGPTPLAGNGRGDPLPGEPNARLSRDRCQ
jgi:hypothetical protein